MGRQYVRQRIRLSVDVRPNPLKQMSNPAFGSLFKRGKYHASPKKYKGSVYHSTLEANYAAYLDMMKKASNPRDRVTKWERQVKISLDVNGVHIANWYCDFKVWFADGRSEYHEVKGMETDIYRRNVKHFHAQYPKETLVVIKARDYKNLIA